MFLIVRIVQKGRGWVVTAGTGKLDIRPKLFWNCRPRPGADTTTQHREQGTQQAATGTPGR